MMTKDFGKDDWCSYHYPTWRKLCAEFVGKPDLLFLEIGSHLGRSACWWLDNVLTGPGCRLVCADPWDDYPHTPSGQSREGTFDRNTAEYGDRLTKHKAPSRRVLGRFQEQAFDFAYVDGCHEAGDALLDALMVLPLMKLGGVMLFDDYEWDGKDFFKHHLPKPGIDAFLRLRDYQLTEIHRGYQVAVRRVA